MVNVTVGKARHFRTDSLCWYARIEELEMEQIGLTRDAAIAMLGQLIFAIGRIVGLSYVTKEDHIPYFEALLEEMDRGSLEKYLREHITRVDHLVDEEEERELLAASITLG